VKIEHEFTVSAPIQRAWEVLTDVPGIVPCMPGAQLVGREQDENGTDVYQGKVKVRIGPVVSEYTGVASFVEKDDTAFRACLDAKGKDSRGAGNAAATIVISLRSDGSPEDEKTTVSIDTDLKISGKIAQFGSSMIREVSEKLLGQFVACLEGKLHPSAEPEPEAEPLLAEPGAPATVTEPAAAQAKPGGSASVSRPAASNGARVTSTPEVEALELLDLAGNAAANRLIPVAAGIAVLAAIIVFILRRR
jgi:carbon monoxide dehydrogenase subunit G